MVHLLVHLKMFFKHFPDANVDKTDTYVTNDMYGMNPI